MICDWKFKFIKVNGYAITPGYRLSRSFKCQQLGRTFIYFYLFRRFHVFDVGIGKASKGHTVRLTSSEEMFWTYIRIRYQRHSHEKVLCGLTSGQLKVRFCWSAVVGVATCILFCCDLVILLTQRLRNATHKLAMLHFNKQLLAHAPLMLNADGRMSSVYK